MQTKVSVIVPCYGVEKYLDRCMESLVNQTLRDIEIILVDDVSPDRVPEMCDDWAVKSLRGEKVNSLTIPPIKVVHKEKNGGLGYARNTGLEVATGEYVAFVDSDDHVSTCMYELLYEKAKRENLEAVFGGIYMETYNGEWNQLHEFEDEKVISGEDKCAFMLNMVASKPEVKKERCCEMSVCRAIYKRSLIDENKIRFNSERDIVSEDILFNVDILKVADRIGFIDKGFYYYHLNGASLTSNVNPAKFEGYKKLRTLLIGKLKDRDNNNERANRFFIGYCRMFLLQLANTDRKDKLEIIRHIVNDKVWEEVGSQYDYKSMSAYPRIIYKMTLSKSAVSLFVASWLFMQLKKRLGKRL